MAAAQSPLRYPGGKQIFAGVLAHLMRLNGAEGGTYVEPYVGGAGAALSLLIGERVQRIVINDADPAVYAFWKAALERTDEFVDLVNRTPATVAEWARQRAIYQSRRRHSALRLGFATFYLNRCNRSGIIANGGVIGGKKQAGRWKIDARFNREDLAERIRRIALYRERISVHNMDAVEFLRTHVAKLGARERPFVYLDPPYYAKGGDLYLNHYRPEDHAAVAMYLRRVRFPWVLTYDNVREIRDLYSEFRRTPFRLNYSARDTRMGRELMITSPTLTFPDAWNKAIPQSIITSRERVAAQPG